MKVASVFELRWNDKNLFHLWLKTLPINLSYRLCEDLWKRSKEKKTAIWIKEEGFFFY